MLLSDVDASELAQVQIAPRRFDAVTIGLHWLTVMLIVGLFASIWSLQLVEPDAVAAPLLTIHRSLGSVMWGVALCRLGWRLTRAYLPPFPATMGKAQQWAARLSEYGLYALLLIQPVTGLAQSLTRGKPFAVLGLEAPAVMERSNHLTSLFHDIHENMAWALLGLIALHVLAAMFHRIILKDGVLQSMLPWKPVSAGRSVRQRKPGE